MFTYKFLGLDHADAPTPYYYGSVPGKPEPGQILVYNETGNRYTVVRVDGEGLVSTDDGYVHQRELAWADISYGKPVPTLWLQKLGSEKPFSGRSWDADEVKARSQENREFRIANPSQ